MVLSASIPINLPCFLSEQTEKISEPVTRDPTNTDEEFRQEGKKSLYKQAVQVRREVGPVRTDSSSTSKIWASTDKKVPVRGKAGPVRIKKVPVRGKARPVRIKKVPVRGKAGLVRIKKVPVRVKAGPILTNTFSTKKSRASSDKKFQCE